VLHEGSEVLEGSADLPGTIGIELASRQDAPSWHRSPVYQAVLPLRRGATEGYAVLVGGVTPETENARSPPVAS
jgi:uncharacterized protein (DUF1330 family)